MFVRSPLHRFGFRNTFQFPDPFPKESDTTVALRVPNSTDQQPRFKRPSLCVHVPTALHKCAPRLRGLTVRRSELPARGAFFATPYPLTQPCPHLVLLRVRRLLKREPNVDQGPWRTPSTPRSFSTHLNLPPKQRPTGAGGASTRSPPRILPRRFPRPRHQRPSTTMKGIG